MTLALTELLISNRANGTLIQGAAPELVPADLATAYRVQTETAQALGPVAAWKVAPFPAEGVPFTSPILASTVFTSGATLELSKLADAGIEAEIAVTLKTDLPLRDTEYAAEDILQAIGSLHLAIEVIASRFQNRDQVPALVGIADLQNNGAVVVGPGWSGEAWPDFGTQPVQLIVDDVEIERVGKGATEANMLRSLSWLANHAAGRGLPLKAGDVIITGARIGSLPLDGRKVTVTAEGFEPVTAEFV